MRRIHAQRFVFSLAFEGLGVGRRLCGNCVCRLRRRAIALERERGGQMHHTADRDLGVSRATHPIFWWVLSFTLIALFLL